MGDSMSIVLQSTSGGSITINEPTTASNFTQTLPAGTGTIVVSGQNSAITASAAVASTSGTSIDFTSIPTWVKRITVMLNGVSTNGTTAVTLQIGSGSYTTSGYTFNRGVITGTNTTSLASSTTGFEAQGINAATVRNAIYTLTNITGNTWMCSLNGSNSDVGFVYTGTGFIALGGVLDRLRVYAGGTDTFDAGSINILYE